MQRMMREIQNKYVITIVLCSFDIGTIKTCPPGHFSIDGITPVRFELRILIVIHYPLVKVGAAELLLSTLCVQRFRYQRLNYIVNDALAL